MTVNQRPNRSPDEISRLEAVRRTLCFSRSVHPAINGAIELVDIMLKGTDYSYMRTRVVNEVYREVIEDFALKDPTVAKALQDMLESYWRFAG